MKARELEMMDYGFPLHKS
jgi:hypothetical protein